MKRYFVKSLFRGWVEVDKECFDRFVNHKIINSTGVKDIDKERFIKTITKIVEDNNNGVICKGSCVKERI